MKMRHALLFFLIFHIIALKPQGYLKLHQNTLMLNDIQMLFEKNISSRYEYEMKIISTNCKPYLFIAVDNFFKCYSVVNRIAKKVGAEIVSIDTRIWKFHGSSYCKNVLYRIRGQAEATKKPVILFFHHADIQKNNDLSLITKENELYSLLFQEYSAQPNIHILIHQNGPISVCEKTWCDIDAKGSDKLQPASLLKVVLDPQGLLVICTLCHLWLHYYTNKIIQKLKQENYLLKQAVSNQVQNEHE